MCFQKQLWNGHDPAVELISVSETDKIPKENVGTHIDALSKFTEFQYEALAGPFIRGDLEALTHSYGSEESNIIPAEDWCKLQNPNQRFKEITIPVDAGGNPMLQQSGVWCMGTFHPTI